ncbi:MAG TPA: LD-carboxypeptidase [Bacillota bacterium]|nr:LD-carboxypeptidase [Bacillota bacterium]HPZ53636.1 LD-carboxypeptidase [Bacillota bacterium]HQD17197.1 LD-carboxypeptidase [Bacillota bacterium]
MLLPQRLDAGDKVAVVAIASPAQSLRDIHDALELISSSNLSVHIPERRLMWSANKTQYLAGPDWVRVSELNKALSDPTVRAIVCLRGGYGSMRVLRAVNYRSVAADPKPVVGFSDITALLTALYTKCGLVTYHGPVLTTIKRHVSEEDKASARMFVNAVFGRILEDDLWALTESAESRVKVIKHGQASGVLLGGNLSMMCSLLGTPYMPNFNGCLLFLEEVKEPLYRIDRMLTQLELAGVFRKVCGVVLCDFTGCPGAVDRLIRRRLLELNVPAIYGVSAGHGSRNFTLMVGHPYVIDTQAQIFRPA